MTIAEISASELDVRCSEKGLVLVECWAPACGACKVFDPIFTRVGEQHPEHDFLRLNIMSEEGLSESLGVENTPTLMVYRDGVLLFRQAGNYDETQLTDIVGQAAAIDMDMVRADIAEAAERDSSNDGS
jgi:thioredoxin 1